MSWTEKILAAESPREALIIVGNALDALDRKLADTDPWGSWASDEQADLQRAAAAIEVAETKDHIDIAVAPVDGPRMQARRSFEADCLHLADDLGDGEDWNEAYAKGGPLWLYHGNRELVMTLALPVRAAMVKDIEETAGAELAQEIGRDILKGTSTGTGDTLSLGG